MIVVSGHAVQDVGDDAPDGEVTVLVDLHGRIV